MRGMKKTYDGLLSHNIVLHKNVLHLTHFTNIVETISSPDFPWFFQPDVTYGSKTSTDSINHGFRHSLIKAGNDNSNFSQLFLPLAWIMADCLNRNLNHVYSMHINLMENYNKLSDPKPHIDRHDHLDDIDNMFTGIFYFDSVDGDTVFYENDKKTIIYNQSPIANSLIVFPAKIFHSGTNPMVSPFRRVLNINITVNE